MVVRQSNLKLDIEKYLLSDDLNIPPPLVSDASFTNQPRFPNKSRLSRSELIDRFLGKPYRKLTGRRVRHQTLDNHLNIAWDFDATLIGGPQSWFWRRWVRDNYKVHNFWILTFRSPFGASRVWSDLSECRDPLEEEWFEGVRCIDPILWNAWVDLKEPLQDLDHESKLTPQLEKYISDRSLDIALIIAINRAIRAWKATECKKLNCTLLVEDREAFCKPYCDALGVTFINALDG